MVRVLETGGTINKEYKPLEGKLGFHDFHLESMLQRARVTQQYTVESVYLMDSLEMAEAHREEIAQRCLGAPENHILIGHGTDTMVETGKLLATKNIQKTIVLFGSMIPYKYFHSDALFNIGFAFASVQNLPVGVYIAMNGQVFDVFEVEKNKELGEFVKKTKVS